MKIHLFLLCLFLIGNNQIQAQNKSQIQEFHKQFQEVEFDILHVYTNGPQNVGAYSDLDLYPFKGIELEKSFNPLLKDLLEDSDASTEYFAIYRYYITAVLEGLILRAYDKDMRQNTIYCVVYNNKEDKLIQIKELASDYHSEGGNGATQSWITDLNKDLIEDILTRSYYETYKGDIEGPEEFIRIYHDSVYLSVWDKNKLKTVGVSDTLLRNKLQKKFPYKTIIEVDYPIQKDLKEFIKGTAKIEPSAKRGLNAWAINVAQKKDLESIKKECKRIKEAVGPLRQYNMTEHNVTYFQKEDTYYVVINYFWTKNDAEIALTQIQKELAPYAFVVPFKNWCPVLKAQKGGFYKCEEIK